MPNKQTVYRPSPWHDLARDWHRWNKWERRCATAFGFGLLVVTPFILRWSYHAAQLF